MTDEQWPTGSEATGPWRTEPAQPIGPRATGPRGAGPGPGLVLAGLLALIVVFGAGLAIGQGFGGAPSPTATPIAAATATPSPPESPTSAPTDTDAPSPTVAPSDATTPSLPPSAEPTLAPTPSPTPVGPPATQPPDAPSDFGLFWEAYRQVRDRYVGRNELTDEQLTYGAIRGMIEALGDTGHSVFLTPEELAAEQESLQGNISGIGATLGERGGRSIIVSVIDGAPADRAGIRPGDLILAIDGEPADRLSTDEIVRLVRGDPGTEVTVTVQHRDSTEATDVTMTRERIDVPLVTWAFVPGTQIADVRLISFAEGSSEAVTTALREALDAGAQQVILDLRSNPGGFVADAVTVSSQFLSEGTVYQKQDANGTTEPVPVEPGGIATAPPLVVLVDEGTASSAEITAGAIQDNDRGTVVGTRTFGTGTVLNTLELSDGSAVRLGVERWLTPDGRLIFDTGIEPDEVVQLPLDGLTLSPGDLQSMTPEELADSGDTQMLRAIELLGE